MKSEKLMDYIGQIDDKIIIEADAYVPKGKAANRFWLKWIPVAAAICLIFVIPFMRDPKPGNADFSELPKLSVNTNFESFGFEGLLAYDVNELLNANPWTENNDITAMPVFTNPNAYDSAGEETNGLSSEEMLAEAEKIANIFSLEITSLYTEPTMEQSERIKEKLASVDAPEEEIRQNTSAFRATAECRGVIIEVKKDGYITVTLTPETADLAKEISKLSAYDNFSIEFDFGYETVDDTRYSKGLLLPDKYSFTYEKTSNEQDMEITQYLFSEYGVFSGIKTPGYDLSADYTYSGELKRLNTFVFENAGSFTERILNYHFNRLYFGATDLGGLGDISCYSADLSHKIGDYPIITAEEARELLLEKRYITTIPEEMPGEQYIAHVELTYRIGGQDSVFMPYYKFLVEMPEMQRDNGLKTFGAFYVPAIEESYLTDIPLWDGNFN